MNPKRSMKLGVVAVALAIGASLSAVALTARHTPTAPSRTHSSRLTEPSTEGPILDPISKGQHDAGPGTPSLEAPFRGEGTTVSSIQAAQQYVTFQVVAPRGFKPDLIVASKDANRVALVFHLGNGTVDLYESATDGITSDAYATNSSRNDMPDRADKRVTFDGNHQPAWLELVVNSPYAAGFNWIDDALAVKFELVGQYLTPGKMQALAAQMIYGSPS